MNNTNIPALLFVGSKEILEQETELLLQQEFCKQNKDKNCYCKDCRKIKNKQHENVIFINPEKDYSVADLDIIFETISLSVEHNQKFFFILQKAQTLSTATSNKLLKILEEPPLGYNFILHTSNKNFILPTITSRCFIKTFKESADTNSNHPILSFFYEQDFDNPQEFEKTLKEINLTDTESFYLLDNMLNYYAQKIIYLHKNNIISSDLEFYLSVLDFIKRQIKMPPQSGSSKLFWKNLYINFPQKKLLN